MSRKFLFSVANHYTSYEQRIGSFHVACPSCHQPAWQLAFRMFQIRGHNVMHQPEINERFQIRCSACGTASSTLHPSLWVPQLTTPFNAEEHPAVPATPAYAALVYPP
jgi:hypothetical protein